MSKVFRVIGQVAAIAAMIPGPHQPIAAAIATTASVAAQLTAKKPVSRGQVNDRLIGANNPQPYLMGRSYTGGVQVHDVAWGGSVNKVKNPYRFIVTVASCCGPVEDLEDIQFDFTSVPFTAGAATGYYANYVWRDRQFGARPEAAALQANGGMGTPPDWGADYKLSGFAAIAYSLKWSKKGKRFAGGALPTMGAIWKGVKVYDPRLDTTFPGGSGAHRINDEDTWTYSANPALHALAYAYGRYVNGVKVFGVDLGVDAIDLASVVAWANVCDTNGWTTNGTIYEPGDKWNNLKLICASGGAEPVLAGGTLQFSYMAPRVSLATVGRDDLAGGELTSQIGRGWKERHNTIIPRYRSEDHQWNYVQSEKMTDAAFLAADGEEKADEVQFDLVTDKDQAAQLGTYELYNRRQAGPFGFTAKPHMRIYRPGDCLTLDSELGLWPTDIDVVIKSRSVDPLSGTVRFECEQETAAKHTAALAAAGTAPDILTPPTPDDIDDTAGDNGEPDGYGTVMIGQSYVSGALITATDAGATASITVDAHDRIYPSGDIAVASSTVTGLSFATKYYLYYDDADLAGGTITLAATTTALDAFANETNPDRHYVGWIVTPANGAADTTGYPAEAGGAGWTGDIVPVISGGTGATTAADARENLLPSFTGNKNKSLKVNAGETDAEWVGVRGAMAKKSADQTGANYTSLTAIAWDAEEYDTDAIHDNATNNTRLTVPTGVTHVRLHVCLNIDSITSGVAVKIQTRKNGGSYLGAAQCHQNISSTADRISCGSAIVPVTAGDYFEALLQVATDTSIDIMAAQSSFSMEIID